MGQVCSGSAVSKHVSMPRDPADKELDPIKIRKTKIPDFDAFFTSASEPLNELVEIHNSIAESEEDLKTAAAALQGETQVRLTVSASGRVALVLWNFDKKDQVHMLTAEERGEKLKSSAELQEAFNGSENAISTLNTALEKPSADEPLCEYAEKHGRLLVTKRGQFDVLLRDINVAVFTLRKHLMLQAHMTSLSKAMKILLKELSKVEDVSALRVETDDKGSIKIMNGDHKLNLRKMKKLRPPVAKLCEALADLVDNIETATTSVPELAESSAAFVEESKELPGKIPDAVSSSGLSITELPKAAAATTSNVKALSNGPKIARATTAMVQYAARELVEAASIPRGG